MKKKQKKIFKNLAILFGLILFCLITAMTIKYKQTGKAFVPETFLVFATLISMSSLIGITANKMILHFKNKPKSVLQKQIIPAVLIFYAISYLAAMVSISLGVFAWFIIKGRDLAEFFPHLFKYELFREESTNSMLPWLFFFTIGLFYVMWRKAVTNEQKLEEEKLKYQYRTLKNQVNPHFLFNSLNTLSSLIQTDPKSADLFTQKLSDIYRFILDHEEDSLIPLKEELEFIKNYFTLYEMRDGDKILLEIDVDNPETYKIVPVSLQVLIENALKHNSAMKNKPLKIKITREGDHILVENNKQLISTLEPTSKTGLNNLKDRIALTLHKNMVVEETRNDFMVKIPLEKTKK